MLAWICTHVVEISISKRYYFIIIDSFKNREIDMARMFLKICFSLGFFAQMWCIINTLGIEMNIYPHAFLLSLTFLLAMIMKGV